MRFFLTHLFSLIALTAALAQPANDNCEGAIRITDVERFCSESGAYTSGRATRSSYDQAECFNGPGNDVWFVFTPVKTTVTITVIGATSTAPGGTLRRPEIALYSGSCGGTLNQLRCASDVSGSNITELTRGGLPIGVPLLIRVQGRANATGTFQLCINNFNPPVDPGQDCPKAAILCNKETFSFKKVSGAGEDAREANDAACFSNGSPGNVESSATWFTWTAANDGTLEFTLTPINPSDDLDFVIYELPNGPQDCRNKRLIRCMASGDFRFPSRCMGPTGLRASSTDIAEAAGCDDPRQDNFLAPLPMQRGRSYALIINNFSDTGNGFDIEFGGSGEFQGPEAEFTLDIAASDTSVCVGEEINIVDQSTFALGSIVKWEWNFGPGASIDSASGQGPHRVSYNTSGVKSVVLTVTSDKGCVVTKIESFLVVCCPDHFTLDGKVSDVLCTGQQNGAIDLTVTNPYGPYQFRWSGGQTTEDISGIGIGAYTVTISDAATCDTVISFPVRTAPPFEIDTMLTKPTCNGGVDGAISLTVSGGTPEYQFNWQNTGFSANNNLSSLRAGDYEVIIRDQNNCSDTLLIPLRELELLLDSQVEAVDPPTCNGFADGSIRIQVSNGLGPFEFDWNDGRGFRNASSLTNLRAGAYQVNVRDANLCRGSFMFDMQAPPPLTLDFDPLDPSCNNSTDGEVGAIAGGGVGNYSYRWQGGQQDSIITNLPPGAYLVTVTDGNGCTISGQVNLQRPSVIAAEILEVLNLSCNSDRSGQITAGGIGGTPPFEFSIDGNIFQSSGIFGGLDAGEYTITIRDSRGCSETTSAQLSEPVALTVDAGDDLLVRLGYDARLLALSSNPNVQFQWTPADALSCTACPNPLAAPVRSGVYTVRITDNRNCSATDSLLITVVNDRPIFSPNAFSPNDDGSNDQFTVFGGPAAREIRSLRIFDRWGELVFERQNIPIGDESAGWNGTFNGKPLGSGVFVYVVDVLFIDDVVVTFQGDVTLIR